jgi:hypothetical protein
VVGGGEAAQCEQAHRLHALLVVYPQLLQVRVVAAVVGGVGVKRAVGKNVHELKQARVHGVLLEGPHLDGEKRVKVEGGK